MRMSEKEDRQSLFDTRLPTKRNSMTFLKQIGAFRWTSMKSMLLLLLLFLLSACNVATAASHKAPITIGISLSFSGDFSDDSKYFEQGYHLWADEVNAQGGLLGRPVKLDILSDASSPEQVVTNYQRLITVDHVDLIAGPFSSLLTKPASVIANRFGYAMVEGAGTLSGIGFWAQSSYSPRSCARSAFLFAFALSLTELRRLRELPGRSDGLRPCFHQEFAARQDLCLKQGCHQSEASAHHTTQPTRRRLARRPLASAPSDMPSRQ
jgi:hypothetical protein